MEEKVYNLSLIEEMAMGDEDFIKQLAETIIVSVPPIVYNLERFCIEKDWKNMGLEAHNLKSNILTLQISSLEKDIKALEMNGKNAINPNESVELVQKVKTIMLQAIEQLKQQFTL